MTLRTAYCISQFLSSVLFWFDSELAANSLFLSGSLKNDFNLFGADPRDDDACPKGKRLRGLKFRVAVTWLSRESRSRPVVCSMRLYGYYAMLVHEQLTATWLIAVCVIWRLCRHPRWFVGITCGSRIVRSTEYFLGLRLSEFMVASNKFSVANKGVFHPQCCKNWQSIYYQKYGSLNTDQDYIGRFVRCESPVYRYLRTFSGRLKYESHRKDAAEAHQVSITKWENELLRLWCQHMGTYSTCRPNSRYVGIEAATAVLIE